MVNAAGACHIWVCNVLSKQGVVPEFAGLVRQATPEGRGLVAWEKYRKTLWTHAQVQIAHFHLGDFGFAKRAGTHGEEYSK
jgi:hypothetical protein